MVNCQSSYREHRIAVIVVDSLTDRRRPISAIAIDIGIDIGIDIDIGFEFATRVSRCTTGKDENES